ncbi:MULTISPECIES: sodium/proline symporter PutP [unclassified Cobetia]|uniref:sodium/proline symporter PutP n=1 Tax=unclassified Cobetia TaxID=2609414 RepID=UPI002097CE12|nr:MULTISPECIES: sodium/proline symporter PutP [unclassified Cobetia]MCO7231466.1 sodium/proline symporter PutP [Cobetia sp. Dlab-2-AX]MCO7235219.1 sodium/proline symporter PutP [Cobetia sp. Dlab-2-U]
MNLPVLLSFGLYLLLMLGIGIYFYRITHDLSDYILGGRCLPPSVAALSAGASDLSGWALMGLPGAIFSGGLSQAWIAVWTLVGVYLNWTLVAERLRVFTEAAGNALTVPDYLEARFEDRSRVLRTLSSVVMLVFFTFYVSAGLVGGAVLFEGLFEIDYRVALWLGALVIVGYTFLGGFLAASWTDLVQGLMMAASLCAVAAMTAVALFGDGAAAPAAAQDVAPIGGMLEGVTFLGMLSLAGWAIGYCGQPHVVVRFMAVRKREDIKVSRRIALLWSAITMAAAVAVGVLGYYWFGGELGDGLTDSERVFITLSQIMLNPWVAGFILAGVLAAIMSTVDSQLLVCSSAIAEDIYRGLIRPKASQQELVWLSRASVIGIALLATVMGSERDSSILGLVSYAWGGFGAAFGPVILLSLFWRGMTRNGAIAGLMVGALSVAIWKPLSGGPLGIFDMFEVVPGFLFALIAVVIVSRMSTEPAASVCFDRLMKHWHREQA